MVKKLKARKCRWRKCRKQFTPVVFWQAFHSETCRVADQYWRKTKLLRKAQKIVDAQGAA